MNDMLATPLYSYTSANEILDSPSHSQYLPLQVHKNNKQNS